MKRAITPLLLAILLLLTVTTVSVADDQVQQLEKGDNLLEYLKDHSQLFIHGDLRVSHWKEGAVGIYTQQKDSAEGVKVILSVGRYPLAVLRDDGPESYVLIDTNGDGVLDVRREELFIPFWVVFKNSPNKTSDERILYVMELMYQAFQSDAGPAQSDEMKKAFATIDSYALDEEKENRDLFYMLYFYSGYNLKEQELSLLTLNALRNQCDERLGKVHLLVYLFIAETLINLDRGPEASQYVERVLDSDPDFVPALAYRYKLEKDPDKAEDMLRRLKQDHGDHWVVQKL